MVEAPLLVLVVMVVKEGLAQEVVVVLRYLFVLFLDALRLLQQVSPHKRLAFFVVRNHVVRTIEIAAAVVPRNRKLRVQPVVDAFGCLFLHITLQAIQWSGPGATPAVLASPGLKPLTLYAQGVVSASATIQLSGALRGLTTPPLHSIACNLIIRSMRRRFAARLNATVRLQLHIPRPCSSSRCCLAKLSVHIRHTQPQPNPTVTTHHRNCLSPVLR